MKAIAKYIRISPKKANLVAGLVRNKKATEALNILKFTPKKAAKIIAKVIKSAVSNAKNNFKQDSENLYITQILVTKGQTLKRNISISRGRVHKILKRGSHIKVTVGIRESEQSEERPQVSKVDKSKQSSKKAASTGRNNFTTKKITPKLKKESS